jgi:hypothetical protein
LDVEENARAVRSCTYCDEVIVIAKMSRTYVSATVQGTQWIRGLLVRDTQLLITGLYPDRPETDLCNTTWAPIVVRNIV